MIDAREREKRSREAAVLPEHRRNHRRNPDQHDHALDEVVRGCRAVAAGDDVHGGEDCHGEDAEGEVRAEGHGEEAGEAVVERGGVGHEEDEGDYRRAHLQGGGAVALAEEVGHGRASQVPGHEPRPPGKRHPCEKRADEGVSEADPHGGNAEPPAELPRIAHKDDCREVRRAVREGGEPGAYGASAEDEAVHRTAAVAADEAHCDGDEEEEREKQDFREHERNPSINPRQTKTAETADRRKKCGKGDLNPHGLLHKILNLACLPFHHSRGLWVQRVLSQWFVVFLFEIYSVAWQ